MTKISNSGTPRRVLSQLCQLVVSAGLVLLVALIATGPAAAAEPSGVALNEVNFDTDYVEVINRSNVEVSLANWLLTDDVLDRVPPDNKHRMRFGADAVLAPGARLVVSKGVGGFPFGVSDNDTLRLADATGTLVDEVTLPGAAPTGMTYGRIPDGTGAWGWTAPTAGTPNTVAPGTEEQDAAWLFDPLQVTEIDLQASAAALSQLGAVPDEYVETRITIRNGAITYGPFEVGLRLKGHGSFRTLEGKPAFKIKFGHTVAGQRFHGLKGLTLNNMVQDPSMIAQATASLLTAANGVPSARVGYAYVRLNGAEYGLYANVENVDTVMAKRWFTDTRHIYEGEYGVDASPGRAGEFEVDEGSSTDRSDLEALSASNAGGADGWRERMQPVADLAEMTRVWAAEHYLGHWDGYSIAASRYHPNNYYLHSDLTGRFSLITSGTDATWLDRPAFGAYGNGVLMRACVTDDTCRQIYIDALGQIAASPAVAALPGQARAIRAAIAPWRLLDPRREQTVAEGEAQADAKIAMMDARPAELAAWLANPSFSRVAEPSVPEVGGGGGESNDLGVTGASTPASSPAPPVTAPQKPATAWLRVRPLLGKPAGVLAKPVAGRRFTFLLPVTRSDTRAPLLTGKMAFEPLVAGKVIRHAESFKAGKARLSLVVPKTAKGRLLKVKFKITASGQSASRTFAYAVR